MEINNKRKKERILLCILGSLYDENGDFRQSEELCYSVL